MPQSKESILLVDDDSEALLSLVRALKVKLNCEVSATGTIDKALDIAKEKSPLVCVIDLCLEEDRGVESGFSLLTKLKALDATSRIIVLTGHGDMQYGIRSLQLGAASFLEKPADILHLSELIKDGITQAKIKREYEQAKLTETSSSIDKLIIGQSCQAQKLKEMVLYAASNNQSVFLNGETGTGKGLCAFAIHSLSKKNKKNFVRYQPNYSNADLTNSELFGYVKGAFTGAEEEKKGLLEESDGGTLFLDEIDQLPLNTQVLLLGVLQDKKFRKVGSIKELEVNFRLITASNQDLQKCIKEEKLREDLYHRFAHFIIEIPPLRERIEDVEPLSLFFVQEMQKKEEINVFSIEDNAISILKAYNWPGNVRELNAIVESSAYRAQYKGRSAITKEDVSLALEQRKNKTINKALTLQEKVESYKIKLVQDALKETNGNQVKAAKILGIDRTTLRRILQKASKNER